MTAKAAPVDPAQLARTAAGRYATGDGRFTVEQASGGWMLVDAEQADELGLPLVRGPFTTLEWARAAMAAVRAGPAPVSNLADRGAALPKPRPGARRQPSMGSAAPAAPALPALPEPVPIVVREYRSGDGEGLRALWAEAGFRSIGDDDAGLRRFAQRNPGTFLVATQGPAIVASAMGAWDGRRGWIYHVATAAEHRRSGIATRLVRQVEARLAALGCPRVNAVVKDGNEDGAEFWVAMGYERAPSRQFGRDLTR